MKILENHSGIDARALDEALSAIQAGEVVIYPTDTLYAFGCDALNARAIERLCRIKGINPEKNMLSVVCADLSQASEYARIDNHVFRRIRPLLPGAYTFVLPAGTSLPKVFRKRHTVGVRIPACDFARALAQELGHPVLTSSVDTEEVINELGGNPDGHALAYYYQNNPDITVAIDGGLCPGVPSTVVDYTDSSDPVVIRQGAAPFEQ